MKGIIHNLNGSIQILSMQMELLQRMLANEGEKIQPNIQEQMEQCLEQIDKFKATVELLMQKGIHEDQDTSQMIQLNDLLEEEISLLRNNLFFKHQVRVKKMFSFPLPPLKGYYVDFSQGLFNLIQNALEAMEHSSRKELILMTEKKDKAVMVTIKDSGCGFTEDVKPHLFQPFFTNKGGKHSGLGLFIAREILGRYGASFNYSSQKGETIFAVSFPLGPKKIPGQ
ncbi:MAG: HAMP domain-containing sensor histidine kinase [Thermodesulfobacteriota bacterium]|nr:HAMP domain-containing sensor histidine kinase [Thermodesulfobacteriota bacterium]